MCFISLSCDLTLHDTLIQLWTKYSFLLIKTETSLDFFEIKKRTKKNYSRPSYSTKPKIKQENLRHIHTNRKKTFKDIGLWVH